MSKIKAAFLDRDGVINKDTGYLYKIEDFEFVDGIFDRLLDLKSKGYVFFVVTNQSGIGRGYYTKDDFNILTKWMIEQMKSKGIDILDVQYCPHQPTDGCKCRKPNILMLENIASKYDIDIANSIFIGDKESDMQCGRNFGLKEENLIKVEGR
jgi:D-glycero-D-manno-heptose 1,7-bisphosphate phosphatase